MTVCFCIIIVNVGILLTFRKHLPERTISLRGEGRLVPRSQLSSHFSRQEGDKSHECVFINVTFSSFSAIYLLYVSSLSTIYLLYFPPCLRYIYCIFLLVYDISIVFQNCSDGGVFLLLRLLSSWSKINEMYQYI